jgi:hypothetical protein
MLYGDNALSLLCQIGFNYEIPMISQHFRHQNGRGGHLQNYQSCRSNPEPDPLHVKRVNDFPPTGQWLATRRPVPSHRYFRQS